MASARLSYQHQLLLARTGYLLHPTVLAAFGLDQPSTPSDDTPLEVLDLATGNGIWLTELAHSLSQSSSRRVNFTGLDISSSHFPPESTWPRSTTYAIFDLLSTKPLPDSYISRFDIIHVRLIIAILWQGPSRRITALKTILAMLKPGGYLQWHDGPPPTIATYSVNDDDDRSCTFHTEMHPLVATADRFTQFHHNSMWMNDLDQFVADSQAVEAVSAHWVPMRLDRAKYENDLAAWSLHDAKAAIEAIAKNVGNTDAAKEALDAIEELIARVVSGEIMVGMRTVVVVARKLVK